MQDLKPLSENFCDSGRPLFIAGPCSAENEEQLLTTALELSGVGIDIFRAGIWKPRTKPGGFEGVGQIGLGWLAKAKRQTGMSVATEVANSVHVRAAVEAGVDLLWIGARTTANPFAVQEIADTLSILNPDIPVLVKNPPHPDLDLWIGALERLYKAGLRRLGAVHRGFSAYDPHVYRNLPQWHIPIELRRRLPDLPVLCDPSHIAGKRELIGELSQQAIDLDFNGLMIESHCNPACALSDKDQQLTPSDLNDILSILNYKHQQAPTEGLTALRRQIDSIDNELLDILARRMAVSREIGKYKKDHGMPVFQVERHDDIMRTRIKEGEQMGMSPDFMRKILSSIHSESIRHQLLPPEK